MKKVDNQKRYFETLKWSSKQSETFQTQKSLSAYSAHTLTKIFANKIAIIRPNH
jgi:hypothetical protein